MGNDVLEIDVGNTRIKWRWVDRHGKRSRSQALVRAEHERVESIVAEVLAGASCETCAVNIGSVAGREFNSDLQSALIASGCTDIRFACVTPVASGVKAGYSDVSQLGVDRWLAVLAARRLFDEELVVVVDCGSAITVDVIRERDHLGGYIAPGMRLMRESLFRDTSQVKVDYSPAASSLPGANTFECVNHALPRMLSGLVREILQDYKSCESVALVMTGGDAEMLHLYFERATVLPDLVLDGLQDCI